MKIDRRLNLVLTVDRDEGPAYVHAVPLREEVWERYFLTISKTYVAMIENGGEWMMRMGPRTASMMLRRIATADGSWEGPEGVALGLVAEIRRTTQVMVLTDAGWDMIPLQIALDQKLFDPKDAVEVESAVTFFIACWAWTWG